MQNNESLNGIETDTIGEILNISMGAAATAMSIVLNRQVSITTPHVNVIHTEKFEYKELEPAVGIEIEFINGLTGSNIMIMKVADAKKIVNLMISGDSDDTENDEDSLDEMQISALGEVMNQMMGSSSTALATFLNRQISISTPEFFDVSEMHQRMAKSAKNDYIVSVSFRLCVEKLLDSEFLIVLPVDFAKELVKYAMDFDELEAESGDTETEYGPEPEEAQAPVVTGHNQIPKPAFSNEYGNEINNGNTGKVTMNMKAEGKTKQTKNVSVMPLQLSSFGDGGQDGENSCQVNLDLVMGVELNVTVEIGRTKKLVKEILALHQGSIIELDKQAGEPVDVIINGQLIARGDVVVIDDNFGVRITEIINNNEIL